MYRTIVLAYDGSQAGRDALKQGAELARLCGAKVYLLAVLATDLGVLLAESAGGSVMTDRIQTDVEEALAEGAELRREAGLDVETRLGIGKPAEEIGRVAREVGANLIVVGHREQSTLARWWSGSTGASLLGVAPCSLLVAVA